jgi:hypothetical protein
MKWMIPVLLCSFGLSAFAANEIGYIETFSLAEDRAKALEQLIPGTDDYYFYHCLHYQNTADAANYQKFLALWIKRHNGNTPNGARELINRQALIDHDQKPGESLDYIRRQLNLQFNHARRIEGAKSTLPVELDPKVISTETLTARALKEVRSTTKFSDLALDWAAVQALNAEQRRDLLSRLRHPDVKGLVDLIVTDLNVNNSKGFGHHPIHELLTLDQLDALLKAMPKLRNETRFLNAYLARLRPSNDIDLAENTVEHRAYLDRLWAFVSTLDPVHNSLKACVLHDRLTLERDQGTYDRARFMEYIKLPRNVHYVNPDYLKRPENRNVQANLRSDYRAFIGLPPIGNEEPLVRDYLREFFATDKDYAAYLPYLRDTFLKQRFAETKIENGSGSVEQWASMLSPEAYKALKERVDLDFAHQNQQRFGPSDAVKLDVYVKNAKDLLVKVFEINTFNYYKANNQEINMAINLDGLVASVERKLTFDSAPERRVRRSLNFPELKNRGVYIVELIGNGRSSRALIAKGRLHFLEDITPAGHRFTVIDEQRKLVKNATLWLSGRAFTPEKDGRILVPFSTQPGKQALIVQQGDFASRGEFNHMPEQYQLNAGFYVDRETLVKGNKTHVLIRPVLRVGGVPTSLKLLKDLQLSIDSVDRFGVLSHKDVSDLVLLEDQEAEYAFKVPENLAQLSFTLTAKVRNVSNNRDDTLVTNHRMTLNGIDQTDEVDCPHILRTDAGYVVELLGKNGEARSGRPLQFQFKHRWFNEVVHQNLQSDEHGRCPLGTLENIEWLKVKNGGRELTWRPLQAKSTLPDVLQGKAGAGVVLPLLLEGDAAAQLSLVEQRSGRNIRLHNQALSYKEGLLSISDLPAGDYELTIKPLQTRITLRLTDGAVIGSQVVSDTRALEASPAAPLHVKKVQVADDEVTLQLGNADPFTRVHVFAVRYQPEYALFDRMQFHGTPSPIQVMRRSPLSFYASGRNIGDEYRYILERRNRTKYPGNMLERPGLLLNPWALRETDAGEEVLAQDEDVTEMAEGMAEAAKRASAHGGRAVEGGSFPNLDFLASPAIELTNLAADKNGRITIKRELLGDKTTLQMLVAGPRSSFFLEVPLPDRALKRQDLRLARNLDPTKHFTEQKLITVVPKGQVFTLDDVTTSEFETYDSLASVYRLFATLNNNAHWTEFAFLLTWPELEAAKKQELYSKYASHELSFFLSRKDPAFFAQVIQPYLKNKKDQTFMDHWLLQSDLDTYTEAWKFERLNMAERLLLGIRIPGQQPSIQRHVHDLYDMIPPQLAAFGRRFETAIMTGALDFSTEDEAINGIRKIERLRSSEVLKSISGSAPAAFGAMAEKKMANGVMAAGAERSEQKVLEDRSGVEQLAKQSVARKSKQKRNALYDDFGGARDKQRAFFQKLDQTEELVENNYYRLPIEQQGAGRISANGFWDDYAKHADGNFLSRNLNEATRNFSEMMLALALIDLPYTPGEHETTFEKVKMNLKAASPLIIFHKEIREQALAEERPPILVSQHFYRKDDRYRHVNNERYDKYVKDEFLPHVVYGCQVILTNPSSNPQKLNVLLQIPQGAIPVDNGFFTKGQLVDLPAYGTQTIEYTFYFPAVGGFDHFPVHVAKDEALIAFAEAAGCKVVEKLSQIDKTNWAWISQNGSEADVLTFLGKENVERLPLAEIAWRMSDKAFFRKATDLLTARHKYDNTLWSYGIKHNERAVARTFLEHSNFAQRCGLYIDTPLLMINPIDRHTYQHMEYAPLVNPRAHPVGKAPTILNHPFREQYQRTMRVLSYKATLTPMDQLAVTYYLALQDRVTEALARFSQIKREDVHAQLQYDYIQAYLGMYEGKHDQARKIATTYKEHPVPRWRIKFTQLLAQLDGLDQVDNPDDREQIQAQLAASEPAIDFKVEARKIVFDYQNLEDCTVHFYPMDIELLFSRNPFIQQQSAEFSFIRPVLTREVQLPKDQARFSYELPQQFHSSNVMVEIVAGGIRTSQAYYANTLNVQIIENYGHVLVTHADSRKPLNTVYIKVYARQANGEVKFFKDGYTDFRGKFDFVSLNSQDLNTTTKFALLIMSEEHGAVIKEANPPKQ